MARLKVFATNLGFYETVVAASSMKAALQAWGTHQDLFASGAAMLCTDDKAVAAALAKPGVVLRRAAGSSAAYAAEGGLEGIKIPDAPRAKASKGAAKAPSRPVKPPPDRSVLSAAEQGVTARRDQYNQARRSTAARRAALDQEEEAQRHAFEADEAALEAAREKAAQAYRKAGG